MTFQLFAEAHKYAGPVGPAYLSFSVDVVDGVGGQRLNMSLICLLRRLRVFSGLVAAPFDARCWFPVARPKLSMIQPWIARVLDLIFPVRLTVFPFRRPSAGVYGRNAA
ncbi:hypothetical protein E1292_01390 [Nonomuraea deserti]|uniref:Uncharacterized protein n=1 Tax=Nonomuraea deserti TaxID=1848322 RepID=A0A4R4W6E9_9ACTN|nr:hypothetical protein [Nonomuraea deserti]TDD12527.1 hypothetical protein E1292_01390 [Nonomuraea deserti]